MARERFPIPESERLPDEAWRRSGIGPLRGAGLLIRLRFRRILNALLRRGPGQRSGLGLLTVFILPLFFLGGVGIAFGSVLGAKTALGAEGLPVFLGAQVLVIALGMLCSELGLRGKSSSEGDLEWLLTLPVSVPSLLAMKMLEAAATNLLGWIYLLPFLTVAGFMMGLGWIALPLSIAFTVVIALLHGVFKILLEMLLRRFSPVALLRNVQAIFTLLGMATFLLMLVPGTAGDEPDHFIWELYAGAGSFPLHLPTGLPVVIYRNIATGLPWWPAALELAVQMAALVGGSWFLLGGVLARGAMIPESLLQGVRGGGAETRRTRKEWLPAGIVGKDLRLLLRDRGMLVGTLISPIFIAGLQLVVNPGLIGVAAEDPRTAAAIAYGFGAYMLLFSGVTVLTAESTALWLLYTVPWRISDLLARKLCLWGGIAFLYSSVVALLLVAANPPSGQGVVDLAFALGGVPLIAIVSACFGVFGFNPEATSTHRRLKTRHMYALMGISGLYGSGSLYAVPEGEDWSRCVLLIVFALLTLTLWYRARDHLPFVLDPDSAPPDRLAASDGMLGVLFLALSAALFERGTGLLDLSPDAARVHAGVLATALGCGMILVLKLFSRTAELARDLGLVWRRPFFSLGSLIVLAPLLVFLSKQTAGDGFAAFLGVDPFAALLRPGWTGEGLALDSIILLLAAPWAEEILFRGVVQTGFRRAYGPVAAVLFSAGLFALVQPAPAIPAALLLGLACAITRERSGSLLAPVLLNAAVAAGGILLGMR